MEFCFRGREITLVGGSRTIIIDSVTASKHSVLTGIVCNKLDSCEFALCRVSNRRTHTQIREDFPTGNSSTHLLDCRAQKLLENLALRWLNLFPINVEGPILVAITHLRCWGFLFDPREGALPKQDVTLTK